MFINLTPHTINIISATATTAISSSGLARCAAPATPAFSHEGVEVVTTSYGEVSGLPDPTPGVFFIVSGLVRAALPHRKDLLSPGDLVRDEKGQPIGCRNLISN